MHPSFEEDLLRHERFLLRLARRLAGGEAEAEDLVQDAFVRALERPPERPSALRAWLATVLRRAAGHSARGGRRRAARERAAARPEATAEDARAIDARLDAHAELLALLRDLPEGERQAMFLRYSEDLAPPAIAERLGVPLDTLKTRLRRGRERLRAQLDARHGRRAAWVGLLVPAAAGRAAAPAPSAAVPQVIGAGLVMGATAKVAIGVGACAGAALLIWVRAGHGGAEAGRMALPRTAREAPALELAAVAEAAPRIAQAVPAAEAKGEPPGTASADVAYSPAPPPAAPWPLIVRVAGAPAQGAAVTVQARLDAFGRFDTQPLVGFVGADGEARFDVGPHLAELVANAGGARPEELVVSVDAPDLVPAENGLILPDPLDPMVPPAAPLVVVVRVERAAVVTGRLLDENGSPLSGERAVQAHALRGGEVDVNDSGSVEPSDDGTFRLRVDGEGPYALCALAVDRRPATLRLALERGVAVDAGDVVLTRGLSITGRSLDATRRPAEVPSSSSSAFVALPRRVQGPSVTAALQEQQRSVRLHGFSFELPGAIAWNGEAFELPWATGATAADGSFRIDALGPYTYLLEASTPDEQAPFDLPQGPPVLAPAKVLLQPQAAVLLLTVTFSDGVAPAGTIAWSRGEESAETGVPAGEGGERVLRYALPPGEPIGLRLAFGNLPPAELALETPPAGAVLERAVALAPGAAPARVVLVLTGERVENGMPFTALLYEGEHQSDRSLDAHQGELVLDDLAPGPLRIVLSAGRDRFAPQEHFRDVELALELSPGEDRRVPVVLERGGTLELEARTPSGERVNARCTVSTADGAPLDLVFVARLPNGRVAAHNHLFESGPARAVPELAPGRYRVRVEAPGHEPEELEVLIEAGRTTERSVALRAAR